MNFIKNFKYNYHLKLVQSYLQNGDFDNATKKLIDLKQKDFLTFKRVLESNIKYLQSNMDLSEVINSNIVWLSSFNKKDLNIIKEFLVFYFDDHIGSNFYINYEDLFLEQSKNYYMTEDDVAETQYQKLINLTFNKKKINFILNNAAFFQTNNNLFFSTNSLSKTFIYLVKNPIDTYLSIKNDIFNGNQDHALNYFLNLDGRPHLFEKNEIKVDINIKSWFTNLSSWTNENVKETFRGLVIKYEELSASPNDYFAEIIAHFVQCNLTDNINHKKINDYLQLFNPEAKISSKSDLSGKEKKFLFRELNKNKNQFYEY